MTTTGRNFEVDRSVKGYSTSRMSPGPKSVIDRVLGIVPHAGQRLLGEFHPGFELRRVLRGCFVRLEYDNDLARRKRASRGRQLHLFTVKMGSDCDHTFILQPGELFEYRLDQRAERRFAEIELQP